MMDTHAHTHTYTEHASGKTHRIRKSMMTKKDFKTSKPQSMSKGAFLMGGDENVAFTKRERVISKLRTK